MSELNKSISKNILLILLGLTIAIASNPLVSAKTVNSLPTNQSNTFTIAQAFNQINFNANYYNTLAEADRFYRQGNLDRAEQIQQRVKPNFAPAQPTPPPIYDLSQLDAKAQQYWNTATQAIEDDPEAEEEITNTIFTPLENLVKEYPAFIPGHILLADTHDLYAEEKAALSTIEKAARLYPDNKDLVDTQIDLLLLYDQPLEASIAAREYAQTYPNSPYAKAYKQEADEYFQQYQKQLKSKITVSGILGGIGQVATGNEAEGLQIGQMLLAGEKTAGQSFAQSIKAQSNMVSNEPQLEYLNDIGQRLAKLMGRDEFEYEFYIVEDPTPNAFALPAGKIFFHTGMLQLMDSEAELAGVLAHEIAHSVLSHSYKRLGESALTGTATNVISSMAGREVGTVARIGELFLSSSFSRGKEKQADILGLRVLDAAGYSADGLYNVMAKLKQLQGKSRGVETLLSSHPASEERMRYLEELIQTKGYNRYGYEGVEAYRSVFPR
ncbi:MAG: M48 family metalloprotease [Pleurocapsa sp. MO_226.B13]|nr:M48 family metalloprotease [Pleurocapsa sp. MO_226.B13]